MDTYHGIRGDADNHGKNRKGFTIVELLVVLFIFALLTAMLLPFVIDKLNQAKKDVAVADTRSAWMGLQTIMTLSYGTGEAGADYLDRRDPYNVRLSEEGTAELESLLSATPGNLDHIRLDKANQVIGFVYEPNEQFRVIFEEGKFLVVEQE